MTDTVSIKWLTLIQSLTDGISISNSVENAKFSLLLIRVFKAAQRQIENPFTEDELKKLELSLNLKDEQLNVMIAALMYIVKRSICFVLKPTVLQDDLIEKLNFDSVKAEAFVKLWTGVTKADFNDLQQKQQVEKLSWELNLEVVADDNLKKAVPTSLIQFRVKNNDGRSENVTLEMKEDKLLLLYNQMENIQNILDSLNK